MKHHLLPLFAASMLFVACGGKKQESDAGQKDSAKVITEQAAPVAPEASSAEEAGEFAVIEGMELCELPKIGVKAGIKDGAAFWDITDVDKFKAATCNGEFYRIGEGPFHVDCPDSSEQAIGVFVADRDNHRDIVLFVITSKHRLLAVDIYKEVSMVGGGAGYIPDVEDVMSLKQEGKSVYAINSKGEQTLVRMYSSKEGPYSISFVCGDEEYGVDLSSTWTMRFVRFGGDTYHGTFRSVSKGKYAFVLNTREVYSEESGPGTEDITPTKGTFRLDNNKETILFDTEIMGLPKEEPHSYDVVPLYD